LKSGFIGVNKVLIVGIVIAIVIGISLTILFNNNLATNARGIIPEKPLNTTGRHFSVELNESVSVSERH
jgi:ABC-type phosphate/phosphonate transport system permease subunit